MLEQPYINEPGSQFRYSRGTTRVLGLVIERATGQKISDYF